MVLVSTAFQEERGSIIKLEGCQMEFPSFFFFSIEAMKRNSKLFFQSMLIHATHSMHTWICENLCTIKIKLYVQYKKYTCIQN